MNSVLDFHVYIVFLYTNFNILKEKLYTQYAEIGGCLEIPVGMPLGSVLLCLEFAIYLVKILILHSGWYCAVVQGHILFLCPLLENWLVWAIELKAGEVYSSFCLPELEKILYRKLQ